MKIDFVIPNENNEMSFELVGTFWFAIAIINNISNRDRNSGSMESSNVDMLRLRSHLKRN